MKRAVGSRSDRRRFIQSPHRSASPAQILFSAPSSASSALDRVTTSETDNRHVWQHRMGHTTRRVGTQKSNNPLAPQLKNISSVFPVSAMAVGQPSGAPLIIQCRKLHQRSEERRVGKE